MVTDNQVRKLMKELKRAKTKAIAAAKSGMDEKTARKYEKLGKLPSELTSDHYWRTRENPFADAWPEIKEKLATNPGLEAKTLFDYIQRKHPDTYQDGQLRTLQRHIKRWRALEGPAKEVYFPQVYYPGDLCQSDFTNMNKLGITISGQRFNHLIYHFVLPYSNWESGTICFSESFESLSEGLQNAFWELGGVPKRHRTDRFTAAISSLSKDKKDHFTLRYSALMRYYRVTHHVIGAGKPNENGDIEQRHHRFKNAVEQSLMLRGSRNFISREDYSRFLNKLYDELNAGRKDRFEEELKVLRRLPERRYDSCKRFSVKVGPSSTIRVSHNVYSVNSRLIGETVQIRLYAEFFEIWYGQKCLDRVPRLRGSGGHRIQYRHIIDWLVRKPGAFENYRYHKDMFPTHRFRMAYDGLRQNSKEYLKILHLAARQSEVKVDQALNFLINQNAPITFNAVLDLVRKTEDHAVIGDIRIDQVDISVYDRLLGERMSV